MFEREITDLGFIQRWGIVRLNRPQSVAEHTFGVAMYANDLCVAMNLPQDLHLRVLQYALWHDMDEIFTGDLPGPNKRVLLSNKGHWKNTVSGWMTSVFKGFTKRAGLWESSLSDEGFEMDYAVISSIVKVADWLEAAVKMGTELQLGNQNAQRHIGPNVMGALAEWEKLMRLYHGREDLSLDNVPFPDDADSQFRTLCEVAVSIENCAAQSYGGLSKGPWITKEDERRVS